MVVRRGLEKEKSDDGATIGLIPTHVQEAQRTNKTSQGKLVFPSKGFWLSETNILAPAIFLFCVCVVTKYVTVLFEKRRCINLKAELWVLQSGPPRLAPYLKVN